MLTANNWILICVSIFINNYECEGIELRGFYVILFKFYWLLLKVESGIICIRPPRFFIIITIISSSTTNDIITKSKHVFELSYNKNLFLCKYLQTNVLTYKVNVLLNFGKK